MEGEAEGYQTKRSGNRKPSKCVICLCYCYCFYCCSKKRILQECVANPSHDIHDMSEHIDRVEGDPSKHEKAEQGLQDRLAYAHLEKKQILFSLLNTECEVNKLAHAHLKENTKYYFDCSTHYTDQ